MSTLSRPFRLTLSPDQDVSLGSRFQGRVPELEIFPFLQMYLPVNG